MSLSICKSQVDTSLAGSLLEQFWGSTCTLGSAHFHEHIPRYCQKCQNLNKRDTCIILYSSQISLA